MPGQNFVEKVEFVLGMWILVVSYVGVCSAFYAEMFRRAPVMEEDEERMSRWKVDPNSFLLASNEPPDVIPSPVDPEVIHLVPAVQQKRAA